ncbi:MAG: DNA ligase (NAD(+)) LigA, partial [Spirochaetales bacterium]|nr:DNA ligase (NAD(+)) LigA [Spirochaetales bacterium]
NNDEAALTSLHGIGEKTASRIIEEFSRPALRRLVDELASRGLSFAAAEKKPAEGPQTFAGQSWCVTGSFAHFTPRELAMDEVKKRGGKVLSAVSGNLTHLLAGEKAGSKLEKAKKLGVQIVSEEEFLSMLK